MWDTIECYLKALKDFTTDVKYISVEMKACGLFVHNLNTTRNVHFAKSISHPPFFSLSDSDDSFWQVWPQM